MKDSVEKRAVKIAAKIFVAAGLCRYDDVQKCRRLRPEEADCEECMRKWILSKAKKELKAEADWRKEGQ